MEYGGLSIGGGCINVDETLGINTAGINFVQIIDPSRFQSSGGWSFTPGMITGVGGAGGTSGATIQAPTIGVTQPSGMTGGSLSPSLALGEEPSEIEAGDVVSLKSRNGPLMTVEAVDRDGDVYCVWFDEEGSVRKHTFSDYLLEVCDEEEVFDLPPLKTIEIADSNKSRFKFNVWHDEQKDDGRVRFEFDGSQYDFCDLHYVICKVIGVSIGKNYKDMGVVVGSMYDKKHGSGMIEVSVPNDLLEKMMTSKVGLINKIASKSQSNNKVSADRDDEIVPDFEEMVKQTEKQKSAVIPADRRKVLESGLDGESANETDLAEWLSSVFIEYNPIKMSMNQETYSKLFKVFDGSFDEAGDLWGVKTEVDWENEIGYADYEIIFHYEA